MAEMSEQNRWKKELAQFQKVLANPAGQAIVIVGPPESGKSALLETMLEEARDHHSYAVERAIVESVVVKPDQSQSAMLITLSGNQSRGRPITSVQEYQNLLQSLTSEIGMQQRIVIGIDAEKTLPSDSESLWLQIVESLPDRVKMVFTQRPDGILATNKQFMDMSNVVRIDIEAPPVPDERSEGKFKDVGQLSAAFEKFLAEKKGYEKSTRILQERDVRIDNRGIDKGIRQYLAIFDHEKQKQLAIVEFGLKEDESTIQVAWEHLKELSANIRSADIEGYVVFPDQADLGEDFSIIQFHKHTEEMQWIFCKDFPDYEDLRRKMEQEKEASEDEDSGGEKLKGSVSEKVKVGDRAAVEIIGESKLWEMSTAVYATGDSETEEDTLGFGPYVEAVAEFLVHEDTRPPLTISIEGEWGSGKSSFMQQLQKEIRRIYAEQAKGTCFIVEFDPWRHDKDESLWAAFVLTFLKQIQGGFFNIRRRIGDIRLFIMRYRWSEGWLDFFRFIGFWAAFVVLCVVLAFLVFTRGSQWVNNLSNEILGVAQEVNSEVSEGLSGSIKLRKVLEYFLGGGGLAALVGGLITLSGLVKKVTGNPLNVNLKKYLKHPQYADRVSFIDQLHNDFQKIVSAYTRKERVYVFIDDLDRCAIPKAAELMESINLMLSDNPKLVFIMGMDREKVAAGLAVKHEKLLPYLSGLPVSKDDSDKDTVKRKGGIWYGYSFIEKFIQIPFVLPTPSKDDIKNMLLEMAGEERVETIHDKPVKKETEVVETEPPVVPGEKIEDELVEKPELKPPVPTQEMKEAERAMRKEARKAVILKFEGDDQNFRDVVLMVSEAFGNNPRRVKQFVNLFRLRIRTSASTGLITPEESRFTFAQLGKFVGIGLGWPLFIRYLEINHRLLDKLVDLSEGETKPDEVDEKTKEWAENKRLIGLIKSGCFDEKGEKKKGGEYEQFCMRGLDVEKLLKISPRVIQGEMEQTENLKGTDVA